MASGSRPMRLATRDPHLEAQREYTDRYANLALGRENWRRIAFVSALACALAAAAVIVMALQPRAVPYIVQVDKIGQVMSVTPAQRDGAPPQAVVKAAIAQWIIAARSTSIDYSVQKQQLERVYAMTGAVALPVVNEYYRAHSPYDTRAGTTAVVVQSVLPIGEDSYSANWRETTHAPSGFSGSVDDWQATITVGYLHPTTEAQILANPLGLYIAHLAWAKVGGQ